MKDIPQEHVKLDSKEGCLRQLPDCAGTPVYAFEFSEGVYNFRCACGYDTVDAPARLLATLREKLPEQAPRKDTHGSSSQGHASKDRKRSGD